MPTDYYEPSNQNLSQSEVQKLIEGIFHGPDTSFAQQWAADMARIGTAEGGGQTGIVVNTAFPDAPNYYTTQQYFPGINASPEYSVGLFGEDILNAGSYNLVAKVLGEPGLPAGQSAPTSKQAQGLAKQFAASPSAQAAVAFQMYQNAGDTFAPWTESTARGTASLGGLPSGESIQAAGFSGTGAGSGPGGGGASGGSGGTGAGSTGTGGTGAPSSDPFTSVMQELNNLMHPEFSLISIIKPSSYESLIVMFLVRGAFAVGFAALGIVGALKLASGGKVGAGDLPSLVAGFVAGPETGLANLAGKMFGGTVGSAFKPQREPTEMEQARLALGQERLDLQRRKGYVTATQRQQSLMQQAERTSQQQQQFQLRMQERQERAATQQQQFAERQASTEERSRRSAALRAMGLQQGSERIQQASRRGDIAEAALAERASSRISQARARGTRERRLSRIQDFREEAFPQQMDIQRRRQTSAEQRVQLRRETLDFNKWKANFPGAVEDFFDSFTVDTD